MPSFFRNRALGTPRPSRPVGETRAEVARRRLDLLLQEFEQEAAPRPRAAPVRVVPSHRIEVDAVSSRVRRLQPVHLRAVGALLAAVAVVLVWWLLSSRPQVRAASLPLSSTPSSSAPASPGATASAGSTVVVDVAGKVKKPGIVELPTGSRVVDAVKAAGGVRGHPDTTSLNMARKLVDGEQVLVGVVAATASGTGGAAAPAQGKLDLNTATAEQLDTLPGVGPVTAASIIDWRTEHGGFTAVEDLLDVKGIGDATLADLRDLVTV